jgi:serine protease AprX
MSRSSAASRALLARLPLALVALAFAGIGALTVPPIGPSAPATASSTPAASTPLDAIAGTDPARSVEAIVQLRAGTPASAGRALITRRGGEVIRDLHLIRALGVRMPAGRAATLRDEPAVASVSLNAAVTTSDVHRADDYDNECKGIGLPCPLRTSFIQSTKANAGWKDTKRASTGSGVAVAVIDTGITGSHPDFRTSATDATSRVIASVVTNPDATTDEDTYGHGTHVAGLVAGDGRDRSMGDPLHGRYLGTAPDASIVSVKVSDDEGATSLIDVIHGLQFVVDNKDRYGIRVVNLSLNSTVSESYRTDPLDAAVESAWFKGLVVVTAAGNAGGAPDAVSYAPANDPYVITVGAVDDLGTDKTDDDIVSSWSSRGVTQDGFAKPEVAAPGAHIIAPLAPGSSLALQCPTCVVDGQYLQLGGTSMAAPVVSGIVAGMLAEHPEWTPDMVKTALMDKLRATADGQKREVDAKDSVGMSLNPDDVTANQGLVPNDLINPATGDVDPTRATWRRATWRENPLDATRATWRRATWRCESCPAELLGADAADPTRATWRRATWRVNWLTSFTK